MTWTLWDAIETPPSAPMRPARRRRVSGSGHSSGHELAGSIAEACPAPAGSQPAARRGHRRASPAGAPKRVTMQDRYEALTREMLGRYGVRVRRWRSSMSGVAWQLRYADGSVSRLIESPRPCGPMSAAVFLHEIGHHAIGFGVYSPRCLEEFHAWAFALGEMERLGVAITDGVRRRVAESLWYALDKAKRRGLRVIPVELAPFTERPARPARRRAAHRGARR